MLSSGNVDYVPGEVANHVESTAAYFPSMTFVQYVATSKRGIYNTIVLQFHVQQYQ